MQNSDIYTGQKTRLRAYRKDDIDAAQAFINDPEVKRFLAPEVPFPLTRQDEEKFLDELSAFKDTYAFAIETLDGRYIGSCGINHTDWKNRFCELGIFIGDKSLWGKGYGTDAFGVLVRFAFEQMNLNKVRLRVYDFNERGVKSYFKLGFKHEGAMRQELFKDGQYHDIIMMGLLREEWLKMQHAK
jgi:RimJ/RimL family protein N-acetyltransferase